jgi:hypothetical protein
MQNNKVKKQQYTLKVSSSIFSSANLGGLVYTEQKKILTLNGTPQVDVEIDPL